MEEGSSPQEGEEGYEGQTLGRHEIQQWLPRVRGQLCGYAHREQSSRHAPRLPDYEAGVTVSKVKKEEIINTKKYKNLAYLLHQHVA